MKFMGWGVGFHKTTLKNIFRGGVLLNPAKKGTRIELFMVVVQKPPPKVKFTWIFWRGCQKTTLKTHLGEFILNPPPTPKKKIIKIEILEVVVKKRLQKFNSRDFWRGGEFKNHPKISKKTFTSRFGKIALSLNHC